MSGPKTTTISTGIRGLDLVLGGGIQSLARGGSEQGSAVILVRGAAGTGKTLVAQHLARAVAEARRCDIAYLCTELLPEELTVSMSAFAASHVPDVIVPDRFAEAGPCGDEPRIFYALESITEQDDARARLEAAMPDLLDAVKRATGAPAGVLVVDSLTDGYQLGAQVTRPVADGAAKLAAQRGVCLILVEEAVDLRPSPWSFAVDTVLELALQFGGNKGMDRTLTVTKHRLGWCDPGPHELFLDGEGLEVFPRSEAYSRRLLLQRDVYTQQDTEARRWNLGWLPEKLLPSPDGMVIAVWGAEAERVRSLARRITTSGTQPQIEFDLRALWSALERDPLRETSGATDFAMHPHRMISVLLWRLMVATSVSCVTIGDLQSAATWSPLALRTTIRALARLTSRTGLPLVLYQTTAPRRIVRDRQYGDPPIERIGDSAEPFVAEFADISFELVQRSGPGDQLVLVSSRTRPLGVSHPIPGSWW